MSLPVTEDATDFGDADSTEINRRLLCEIENSEKAFEDFFTRCRKINKRYLDERDSQQQKDSRRLNILWSNIETTKPAVYSQVPKPQIERRYKDQDPVGRAASQILERCAEYSLDCQDFDGLMESISLDYLLFARGQAWVRYKPYFEPMAPAPAAPVDGTRPDNVPGDTPPPSAPDDLQPQAEERLAYEAVERDYIHREDFLHSLARSWTEVWWVARKVYLTRKECIARFGEEKGKDIPLDAWPESIKESQQKSGQFNYMKKARVFELWCKSDRKVYWLARGVPDLLDVKEDWLKLEKFFPCPRPVYGTVGNDSLVPVPDYAEYQNQAEELDDLSQRISMLTKALKVVGVYDGSITAIQNILQEGHDNTLIPVENWAMIREKGGLDGIISMFPVEQVAKVLLQLFEARDACKQEIYEITGLSDIIRGSSNAQETAAAQQIKSQFGSMRLRDKQKAIQRFARDVIRLESEIIAEHFSPQTLMLMSNINLPPKPTPEQVAMYKQQVQQAQLQAQMAQQQPGMQPPPPPQPLPQGPYIEDVMALLRNDGLRGFRIDIETDSTIFADQQQEKQLRTEFLTATGAFINSAVPIIEAEPGFAPLLGELLMFGIRGFGGSTRTLEQPFEDALAKMQQAASQPKPPPPPDPSIETAKINQQTDMEKIKADAASHGAKLQSDEKMKMMELGQKHEQAMHQATNDHAQQIAKVQASTKPTTNVQFDANDALGEIAAQFVTIAQQQQAQAAQQSEMMAQALASLNQSAQAMQIAIQGVNAPKQVVRGADGRVVGIQPVSVQ